MLNDVKLALRISHNALDGDITDSIEAARQDLQLSGISSIKANDDADHLIKRAIKTYCKAEYEEDVQKAERFRLSYDLLKNHLSLAGDYKEGVPVE
ncbi:head-tail connector protein [Neobacillus sp. OS1-2]|uniref:head-tail connector protein n=1 Tax=Neobacillus sp. OS1-2 TaxID=3070680 RepID=UPI0027E17B99|nr:head-tail connector protein [Neobacillus sp. OS1-2]WML38701.1 head-tail connector protein [Neobacillus sp. OS1-2]